MNTDTKNRPLETSVVQISQFFAFDGNNETFLVLGLGRRFEDEGEEENEVDA